MPAGANPLVAFDPVEVDVNLSGYRFTIPAHPASVWLQILTDEQVNGLDVLPGLLDEEGEQRFDELVFSGGLERDEYTNTIYEIIAEVSGHTWWWTMHLLSLLQGPNATQWLGEMTRLDASRVSLGAWLNSLYSLLVKYQKEEDRMRLDMELEMPPPGIELEISQADQKATEQAFFSMMRGSSG